MSQGNESTEYRLFVALPIPDPVKDEIERLQDELRAVLPPKSVRWTKREQFHLTLRFLGQVSSQRVPALTEALRGACSEFAALKLRAELIGCFPSLRFPRVLWVWVHDEAEQLPWLQERIELAVGGFAAAAVEKDFTGHVTIARINGIRRAQAEILGKRAHESVDRRFGEWTANEVRLIQSELFPSGARHTVLGRFVLAG